MFSNSAVAPGDVLEFRGEPLLQLLDFLLAVFQLFQQVGVGGAQGGGFHGAVGGQAGLLVQFAVQGLRFLGAQAERFLRDGALAQGFGLVGCQLPFVVGGGGLPGGQLARPDEPGDDETEAAGGYGEYVFHNVQ